MNIKFDGRLDRLGADSTLTITISKEDIEEIKKFEQFCNASSDFKATFEFFKIFNENEIVLYFRSDPSFKGRRTGFAGM